MDRLEQLRQKIENKDDLSLEELTELDAEIKEVFNAIAAGEIEGVEAGDFEVLSELHDAQQEVRAHGQELQAEVAEKQAKIAKLAEAVNAEGEGSDDDSKGETEDDDKKEVEVEVDASEVVPPVEPEVKPEEEQKEETAEIVKQNASLPALAAAAQRRKQMRKQEAPIRTNPRQTEFSGFTDGAGNPISSRELAENIINTRERFGNHIGKDVDERITMAQFKADIPEDRMLSSLDSQSSTDEKVNAIVADAMNPDSWTNQALVASGGWCAPLATSYAIETIAGAQRPVRDSLPRFGADRGGLRFRKGISLAQGTAVSSTGIWTNATDITPGGSTKKVGLVSCDSIQEVTTNAVYRQLKFGNLRGRADAEGVAAWVQVTAADWARVAETQLLDGLSTNSVAVSTDQHMGWARDFLHQLGRAAATYRNRNRMDPDAMLRAVIPSWLPDAIVVDIMMTGAPEAEFFSYTRDDVLAFIRARNINVTEYLDSPTGAGQNYGPQTAEDLLGWKSTAVWFLFHEGAFLFLDSGTLDLGVVRDSTLNSTNDYELFAENFENIAYVGVESLKITSSVCVNGTSSATKDFSAQCQS